MSSAITILKAFYAGERAKRNGESNTAPKKLPKDCKTAWHNGWQTGPIIKLRNPK